MADTRGIRKENSHATLLADVVWCTICYLIVSSDLYSKIADFSVGELYTFSDHCRLTLAINFSSEQADRDKSESRNIYMCPLIKALHWNEQARVKFDQAIKKRKFRR